jgi:methionyl-tRNA formyltransferase
MSDQPLKVVFFGSGRFAVKPLESVLNRPADFQVQAVVCQPDRPAGRSKEPQACPVAQLVQRSQVQLLQPERAKGDAEFVAALERLQPDLALVAAYGQILPQAILDIPRLGSLNFHGSLLPRWRGASPIQAAIRVGDEETGVTLMLMDAQLDHGPIIDTRRLEITPNDTYLSLELRLSQLASELLDSVLAFAAGEMSPVEQDHAAATVCRILKREDGRINWQELTADQVLRHWRAYQPWPGIYTEWNRGGDKPCRIKLAQVRLGEMAEDLAPGTVTTSANGDLGVVAADGRLVNVSEAQLEGKPACQGKAIACGYQSLIGAVL